MKKLWIILIVLALVLTGCARGTDRHPEWDGAWTRFGDILAVESPEGFALDEFNDTLSVGGIWYGTWTRGDGRTVTGADGEEATAYDVQIYLVLKESKRQAEAEADVADWLAREGENYEAGAVDQRAVDGQSYRLLPLLSPLRDNPYARGMAAFAIRDSLAVSVEVLCGADFQGDEAAILEEFLNGIHFGQ